MTESILDSTKKMVNIDPSDTAFDVDILVHINSVFAELHQLGVGPEGGFEIVDNSATWDDFTGGDRALNPAKTYMYLNVRMLFDPPGTSFVIAAFEKSIERLAWRLNMTHEGRDLVSVPTVSDLDGGDVNG